MVFMHFHQITLSLKLIEVNDLNDSAFVNLKLVESLYCDNMCQHTG